MNMQMPYNFGPPIPNMNQGFMQPLDMKIDEIERRITELENKVKELEKKSNKNATTYDPYSTNNMQMI